MHISLDFKAQVLGNHNFTTSSLAVIPRVASLSFGARTVPCLRSYGAKTSTGLSRPTFLETKRGRDILLVGFDGCFLMAEEQLAPSHKYLE